MRCCHLEMATALINSQRVSLNPTEIGEMIAKPNSYLRSYLHLITAREGKNLSSLGAWPLVHLPCSSE